MGKIGGEGTGVSTGLAGLPAVEAREQGGPRWTATGRGHKGVGEQDTLPRHAVEGGRTDGLVAVGRGVGVGLVVGNDEEDIGTGTGGIFRTADRLLRRIPA